MKPQNFFDLGARCDRADNSNPVECRFDEEAFFIRRWCSERAEKDGVGWRKGARLFLLQFASKCLKRGLGRLDFAPWLHEGLSSSLTDDQYTTCLVEN